MSNEIEISRDTPMSIAQTQAGDIELASGDLVVLLSPAEGERLLRWLTTWNKKRNQQLDRTTQ